ncbi:MAG: Coenzyme F420 hydrogenase/dehydrogenase, beta subunit C-terminal domain [Eubacterium sp.]|nr:Coenzyme F420 hydrogenase/dehydrogenase, beta subunit C-terminal domain [Eubacterium sp.]
MTKYVCTENMCTGCSLCADLCKKNAITIKDEISSFNAVINQEKCVDCGLCTRVCQNKTTSNFMKPIAWFQGWATESEMRENSSSGGFASALAETIINREGIVCSCTFDQGEFTFCFIESTAELERIKGSKYVKSNPHGVYSIIKEYLIKERDVLFIGLPCQVAALKIFVGAKFTDYLYTVDLICHGTPSPKLLDAYLYENGIDIKKISSLLFRKKDTFRVFCEGKELVPHRTIDWYTYLFLQSIDYTDNCYNCQFAKIDRVSDITIGDSWKSNIGDSEIKKGISLALCQTEKGIKLLKESNLNLYDVDLEQAILANHQLRHPSVESKYRRKFLYEFDRTHSFQLAIFKCFPKLFLKNMTKTFLCKIGILK